jgi:anhydro-N-acetylmuramic acid kinase
VSDVLSIGLMSGTSRDGIDAALIGSDGAGHVRSLQFTTSAYSDIVQQQLADACTAALAMERPQLTANIAACEAAITDLHIAAVQQLLTQSGHPPADIDVIGFHGHTVAHRPERGWTWQIGDAQRLADATGITVVADFRSGDVALGGQGAPLIPVYHQALCASLDKPVVVLNLGGVANLTYIGADGALIAFDCGMASALVDDWMRARSNMSYDKGGQTAAQGHADEAVLNVMLSHAFFNQPAPKSLERAAFSLAPVLQKSIADGAATLTAFTAAGVAHGIALLPERPKQILVCGGGRHNATMMQMIAARCSVPVTPVDGIGWNGDATEAEGFAYMAVRRLRGLPISFPGTTGAPHATTGGRVFKPCHTRWPQL